MRKLTEAEDRKLHQLVGLYHRASFGDALPAYTSLQEYVESLLTPVRTDQEILDQTEALAKVFAHIEGFELRAGLCRESNNPRAQKFWNMACAAQLELTDTDPNEIDVEPFVIADKWKRWAVNEHLQRFNGTGVMLFDQLVGRLATEEQNVLGIFDDYNVSVKSPHESTEWLDLANDIVNMAAGLQHTENEE